MGAGLSRHIQSIKLEVLLQLSLPLSTLDASVRSRRRCSQRRFDSSARKTKETLIGNLAELFSLATLRKLGPSRKQKKKSLVARSLFILYPQSPEN
ncbi:uncharacterized protein BO72DRAFT_454209 [Aspergillus fijiensis CBS 313.89]|uniref:Uncharacterized protein n=1 Tax=Aspergillus fijiensis CBS 313.89 TaxID=1448319 RepID=A0A8G1RI27_9EURO|nr:uncharacterized protein BO72DRAFT_454209 [Aspergillus fijiensis CBS 313.89]RAK70821.1 hypothetical protein BO72DRAFT_454209 [Aspergillus fijiensis CBS 313.89]